MNSNNEPFSNADQKQSTLFTGSNKGIDTNKDDEKSFSIDIPKIELPKGGGAIRGIQEKFEVNAVNGTSSLSIPLPFSPSRQGFQPQLALSYNSGNGNSSVGIGWSIGISSISRSTNKKIPEYRDSEESDTFMLAGAEDLIPKLGIYNGKWSEVIKSYTENGIQYSVKEYRPRIEGLFAKIEKLTDINGIVHWRTISRDNVKTFYGFTGESRIFDPKNPTRIFQWYISHSYDDKGNLIIYRYKPEDSKNILNHSFEKNKNGNCTNTYIKKIVYGNRTPFKHGDTLPDESEWQNEFMFHTLFDYGEHDSGNSENVYNEEEKWDCRNDAYSNYRAGFEIRTIRKLKRVLNFHLFKELKSTEEDQPFPYLVKSLELRYKDSLHFKSVDKFIEGYSLLTKVTQKGHRFNTESKKFNEQELPAMEFTYQEHEWKTKFEAADEKSVQGFPFGIDGSSYLINDLYNEGIPGILNRNSVPWYYSRNVGSGCFAPPEKVNVMPNFGNKSGIQVMDVDGNGEKAFVSYNQTNASYAIINEDEQIQQVQNFKAIPYPDIQNERAKYIDLNGDNKADLIVPKGEYFLYYPSDGKKGFKSGIKIKKPSCDTHAPTFIHSDEKNTIFIADMVGDGLSDIVKIENDTGLVCYWANMGYGKFSPKVIMGNLKFGSQKLNPQYIKLSDIDGGGSADIIYIGNNKFQVALNMSGNYFNEEVIEIENFQKIDTLINIQVTDFLGTGTACIVYSSPHKKDEAHPVKYLEIMDGKKPFLLNKTKNGYGKEINLSYCTSTKFYLEDKKAGNPWVTKLPFPVHVLEKTETRDYISGSRYVSSYKYHHGFYDLRYEKEFRGFGMVEQIDTEDYDNFIRNDSSNAIEDKRFHEPKILTKTWYHTGAYLQKSKILNHFKKEYYRNPQIEECQLPDARIEYIGDNTTVYDEIEAHRACKNMMLRKEVFSYDTNNKLIETPYVVEEHNCHIKQLQPKSINKYGSFIATESEAITYHYEQNSTDPRIAHSLNFEIDELGNVLKSLSVVYPRENSPDIPSYENDAERNIILEKQKDLLIEAQKKLYISYTENSFTNDAKDNKDYRLRMPCETTLFEISNLSPSNKYFNLYENNTHLKEKLATVSKKLLKQQRIVYAKNNFIGISGEKYSDALEFGKLESLALPFETYKLAFTNELCTEIFGEKLIDSNLEDAKYIKSNVLKTENTKFPVTDNNNDWWIPSGRATYSTKQNSKYNFYQPDVFFDPFQHKTLVEYNSNGLYLSQSKDEHENITKVSKFDFRVLAPIELKDQNDNCSEVRYNTLGLVAGVATKDKGNDGDNFTNFKEDLSQSDIEAFYQNPVLKGKELLNNATSRFVYDLKVQYSPDDSTIKPKPLAVASINREEHSKPDVNSKLQYAFEYSNGLGEVMLQKIQAQPGIAYKIDENGRRIPIDTGNELRWIGNGRVVKNNKGNPIMQYEPYFSTTHNYEDDKQLVEIGYSPLLFYDALGRNIRTENPDGTFTKVEFDAWQQQNYDGNDTVEDSKWYSERTTGSLSDKQHEKEAALKAQIHYNTPSRIYLDSLGRPVYTLEHNREKSIVNEEAVYTDAFYGTFIKLDIEGQQKEILSAKGHTIIDYKYDLASNPCYQNSRDAGKKWTFVNVMGNPLFGWDANGNRLETKYDDLNRPIEFHALLKNGSTLLFEKIEYGDRKNMNGDDRRTAKLNNLLGQVYKLCDGTGITTISSYDFKGNPLQSVRKICENFKKRPDWNNNVALTDDEFIIQNKYDGLNRVTKSILPDKSVHTPVYNETGQLNEIRVSFPAGYNIDDPLDVPHADGYPFVKNIWYNAKGQREKIRYGNDTITTYTYNDKNYRLTNLKTTCNTATEKLQDLYYTYDPVGNITNIEDASLQTIYFRNTEVKPIGKYEYDALYRLIEAVGREHAGNNNKQRNHEDIGYNDGIPHQNDSQTLRNYKQRYAYDELGNILYMKHNVKDGADCWKRFYHYNRIHAGSNQLTSTSIDDEEYNPSGYPNIYTYDANGNMLCMPHLPMRQNNETGEEAPSLIWDFKNQLQEVDLGNNERAYYNYDSQGQRIRKTIIRNGKRLERIYLGRFEVYREYNTNDTAPYLERWTLRINDDTGTIAQTDTKTIAVPQNGKEPDASNPLKTPLVRFQYSNHLGTATVETDLNAIVISYEEYHPYGTSAYRSSKSGVDVSLKRYRYTGKERDDETGLYYYGARYYLTWLARWTCPDSAGFVDGLNLYQFVQCNPVILIDIQGNTAVTPEYLARKRQEAAIEAQKLRDKLSKNYFSSTEEALAARTQGQHELMALEEVGFFESLNPFVSVPNFFRKVEAESNIAKANYDLTPVSWRTGDFTYAPAVSAVAEEIAWSVAVPAGTPAGKSISAGVNNVAEPLGERLIRGTRSLGKKVVQKSGEIWKLIRKDLKPLINKANPRRFKNLFQREKDACFWVSQRFDAAYRGKALPELPTSELQKKILAPEAEFHEIVKYLEDVFESSWKRPKDFEELSNAMEKAGEGSSTYLLAVTKEGYHMMNVIFHRGKTVIVDASTGQIGGEEVLENIPWVTFLAQVPK